MDDYLATEQPEWILIFDEPPPTGKTVHLLMEYGGCIKGAWYSECGAIAWRSLPKLLPEQKRRINALRAAGWDITQHKSRQFESQTESHIAN